MKCCYCERILVCEACGAAYRPASPSDFVSLHQRETPVVCPACQKMLRCAACGAIYSGGDEEYEPGGPGEAI